MFKSSAVIIGAFAITLGLSACSGDAITGADAGASLNNGAGSPPPTATTTTGLLRLRCEVSATRSKVSVDGNNLRPLGGMFSARIRSGSNSATASAIQAVGDEAEFDFDSNANDVSAGATAIAPTFIQVGPGADITAEILNANGVAVANGSAECVAP
ncbi:MAG TPA: hypothetical protein VGD27_09040 [Longimicrobiales bacterium]